MRTVCQLAVTIDVDIAVLGAGPAGATAAAAAAARGLRVVLVDEQDEPGGQVWRAKSAAILDAPVTPESRAGDALRARVAATGLVHLPDTRLWHLERPGDLWNLHLAGKAGPRTLKARALILAGGASEIVQPFPGWTLPGVLGLAGTTVLMKRTMRAPGGATIVAGTGPLVFFVASEIRRLGGTVAAVITPAARRDWLMSVPAMLARPDLLARGAVWLADLLLAGVPIWWRHAIRDAQGSDGLEAVRFGQVDATWAPVGPGVNLAADSLCIGNGLAPSVEAAQLAGLDLRHDDRLGGWVPDAKPDGGTPIAGLFVCGDGAGIRGAAAAMLQGRIAGEAAASHLGAGMGPDAASLRRHARAARFGIAMTALSIPRPGQLALARGDTIICRCEGVTRAMIEASVRDGAASAGAVKSELRVGMGPCGGRYCQTAVAQLVARAKGCALDTLPPPVARPPLRPVPLGVIAGEFAYDDLPIPKPAPL